MTDEQREKKRERGKASYFRNRDAILARRATKSEGKKAYNLAYYKLHKSEIIAQHRAYRAADHTKALRRAQKKRYTEKHRDALRIASRRYESSERRKQYKLLRRDKSLAGMRKLYLRKRDERMAYASAYRAANLQKTRDQVKAWRKANPEKIKAWEKNNRDRLRAIGLKKYNKRRAIRLGAQIGTDRKAYLSFVRFLKSLPAAPCYWCGRNTGKGRRHVDHIVALNAGGKDDVYNLCCSCPACNCSKQDKLPEVFSGQFHLAFGEGSTT